MIFWKKIKSDEFVKLHNRIVELDSSIKSIENSINALKTDIAMIHNKMRSKIFKKEEETESLNSPDGLDNLRKIWGQ